MDGKNATGKTIGEVEKLTGIPKRELKYYIEQRIMRPSQRTDNGYWLYSEEDIQKARLASLCRSLDFPGPGHPDGPGRPGFLLAEGAGAAGRPAVGPAWTDRGPAPSCKAPAMRRGLGSPADLQ